MELEEAIEKLKNPKKIDLISLTRQFKREGIENFVVTRPEIIETILNHLTKQEMMIQNLKKTMESDGLSYVETQFVLDLIEENE